MRMLSKYRPIWVFAALGFWVFSVSAQTLEDSEQSLVVMFGDSISVGFQGLVGNEANSFLAEAGGGLQWFGCPTILMTNLLRNEGEILSSQDLPCVTEVINTPVRDRIEAAGLARNSIVVNWGISGSTTVSGVNRISSNLNQSAAQFSNSVQRFVLIHYGTNDMFSGVSSSATEFNTRVMIDRARQAGFTPAVSTLLPRFFFNTQPVGDRIRNAGQAEGVPVVDMFNAFLNFPGTPSSSFRLMGLAGQQGGASNLLPVETFSIGGGTFVTTRLHPNDQGYSVMVERWFEEILEDAIEPTEITPSQTIVIAPIINLLLDDAE